jgi:hypothetical protein
MGIATVPISAGAWPAAGSNTIFGAWIGLLRPPPLSANPSMVKLPVSGPAVSGLRPAAPALVERAFAAGFFTSTLAVAS